MVQSHGAPFAEQIPCPYCVIFTAVQSYSRNAAINPATTLVLPTLRECPPTTMIATLPLLLTQPRQSGQLLQIFAQRLRRSSPKRYALAAQNLIRQYTALRAQHHSFFNVRMLANPDLPAENDIILDRNAPGKPGLRRNYYVFAYPAIVPNVHQIVDLRSPPDPRLVQRAAIDRRVGTDLHIIFNHQPPNLRKLLIVSVLRVAHVSKAVAPQHRPGLYSHPFAHSCPRIDRHPWINQTVLSNLHATPHYASCADPRPRANLHVRADHGVFFDNHKFIKAGGRVHQCSGVHTFIRPETAVGPQHLRCPRKRQLGMTANQQRLPRRAHRNRRNHRPRARLQRLREIFFILHEHQIARRGRCDAGDASDLHISISQQPRIHEFSNLSQPAFHRSHSIALTQSGERPLWRNTCTDILESLILESAIIERMTIEETMIRKAMIFRRAPALRALMGALIFAMLVLPAQLHGQQVARRLILKDGSYQSITKYEIKGDRVHYYSAEREEWEELPSSLVDWPATEQFEKDRSSAPAIPEAAALDKELDAEREAAEANLPQVAPGLRLPELFGMYLLDNFKGQPQLVELQQDEGGMAERSKANVLRGVILPAAGAKQTIELEGDHATVYAHAAVPSIYIKPDDSSTEAPAGETASAKPSQPSLDAPRAQAQGREQAQQPEQASVPFDRYHIVRLKVKNGKRIVGDIKRSSGGKISQEEDSVKTTIDHISGGWLKLTPIAALAPGEYAIVEMKGTAGMNLYIWPFSVNPNAAANANPWTPEAPPK